MNCEKFEELLIDYIGNNLEPEEMEAVRKHLRICFDCSKVVEDYLLLKKMLREEATVRPSSRVLDGLSQSARWVLSRDRVPFWKRWLYSPILVPVMSSALAMFLWVSYGSNLDLLSPKEEMSEISAARMVASNVPIMRQQNVIGFEGLENIESELRSISAAPLRGVLRGEASMLVAMAPPGSASSMEETVTNKPAMLPEEADSDAPSPAKEIVVAKSAPKSIKADEYRAVASKAVRPPAPVEGTVVSKAEPVKNEESKAGASSDIAPPAAAPMEDTVASESAQQPEEAYEYKAEGMAAPEPQADMQMENMEAKKESVEKDIAEGSGAREEAPKMMAMRSKSAASEEDKHVAQLHVALQQQKDGNCDETIKTCHKLLEESPKLSKLVKEKVYLALAECYEQKGQFDHAISNYNNLQQVAPEQSTFAKDKIETINREKVNLLKAREFVPADTDKSEAAH